MLLVLSMATYAQVLKDRIQGDWVCVNILNAEGMPATGKYGDSFEYLKFSFNKSKFSVNESPFDKGLPIDIVFKNENSFDWLPGAAYEVPERVYEVKELTEQYLILTTISQNGERIEYHFLNQKNFLPNLDKAVDHGAIIVEHLRMSKTNAHSINRVFEYRITNDSVFLSPSPTFEFPQGGSFGQIFSHNIRLPKNFKLDEITDEMIIEFDVTKDGASNFNITKGISSEIDTEVLRVMEKLRKSWKPVRVNDSPVKTTSRLHLYFYMTIAELQLPWK